jgi:hypothetical protein
VRPFTEVIHTRVKAAIKVMDFLPERTYELGMLIQVMKEARRTTLLSSNNDEIRKRPGTRSQQPPLAYNNTLYQLQLVGNVSLELAHDFLSPNDT